MIFLYFKIQLNRANRALKEFGLSPTLAYPIITLLFIGISLLLFSKTKWASLLYVFIFLSVLNSFGGKQRNDFLINSFKLDIYRKIRRLENIFSALPFLLFVLFKSSWYAVLAILIFTFFWPMRSIGTSGNWVMPTPFSKKPFEFSRGFRKNFTGIFLSYFLCLMGILYGNLNLGLFSIILLFLICLSFYTELEEPYFIWNFSLGPSAFLKYKIVHAVKYLLWLSVPVSLSLCIFFSESWYLMFMFEAWGLCLLVTVILAKYSRYPASMSLLELILLGSCMIAPPLLLVLVPYFYKKSASHLEVLLK